MTTRLHWLTLALLAAAGCDDGSSGPREPGDYPANLSPPEQWAGKAVTLRWGHLATETPSFLLRPPSFPRYDTLHVTRIDDTTVTLWVSELRPAGPAEVLAVVEGGSDSVVVGELAVAGQIPGTAVGTLECPAVPWAGHAPTQLLSCLDGRVVLIDGATGEVSTPAGLEAYPPWPTGIGLSHRIGVVYLPAGPDSVVGWDLASGQGELGRFAVAHAGYPVIEFAQGLWARVEPEGLRILDPAGERLVEISQPTRVIFSPDGEFLVVLSAAAEAGAPVLRTGDGSVAFRLPSLETIQAAVFLPVSESLVVLGSSPYNSFIFRYLTDGTLYSAVELPSVGVDLAVQGDGYRSSDRVLVLEEFYADGMDLRVMNLETWQTVARIHQSGGGFCGGCVDLHGAAFSPLGDIVGFVVEHWYYRFALLPPAEP